MDTKLSMAVARPVEAAAMAKWLSAFPNATDIAKFLATSKEGVPTCGCNV
jgi:hypothetical protein